jgi:hypothetical protein
MRPRNIQTSPPQPSPCPECADHCAEAIKYGGLGMNHFSHQCPGLIAVRAAISRRPRHIVTSSHGRVSGAASVGTGARCRLGRW